MTHHVSPVRTAIATAVLAIAVGGSAGGCGPAHAGAAAIVGGERITVSALEAQVTALAEQRRATNQEDVPAADLTRDQLQRMILHGILREAAGRLDVRVSDSDVSARIDDLRARIGNPKAFRQQVLAANIGPGQLRPFVRDMLRSEGIGQALVPQSGTVASQQERQARQTRYLVRTARSLDITVNPRYGRWQPRDGTVQTVLPAFVQPESQRA
ncbi:MAG: SurA N-terminal domain-containing protein [Carbonactinosporaceae bacterium]